MLTRGETVSNLIRKVVISDAIFRNGFGNASDYDYSISIQDNLSGEEEDRIVLGTINRIRGS